MKHAILTSLLVAAGTFAASGVAADEMPTRTYALIVANNASIDAGVEPLRFADDDGARFFELFDSMVDEAYLLTTLDDDSQRVFPQLARQTKAPSRENLIARVQALSAKIAADREAGVPSEVYLVFTGHGNVDDGGEGYLSLTDQRLRRSDLQRDVISAIGADYTHLIIDACHAYFMVRARGGGDDWKDDRTGETLDDAFNAYMSGRAQSAAMPTVGVILSTAGTAEVHEWSKFRGGVFSHQLRSGLLGAADADADGQVTYRELEAYLVAANVAVTNPRARIRVFAEPPAQNRTRPLTTISKFRDVSKLIIPQGVGGRYHIEDSRGLRYADMNIDPAAASQVVLLHKPVTGPYYLRTEVAQAEIPTGGAEVRSPQLAFAELREQPRGSVEESFRTSLFATPFGPAFVQGYSAGRESLDSTQAVVVPEPSPELSHWATELSFDYALGTAPLRVGGLQHHFSFGLVWLHDETGIGLGPYLGYGFADTPVGQFHRVSAGIELDKLIGADAWRFGPRLRLGNQALFFNADGAEGLAADPVGLRGEVSLVAIRAASKGLSLTVHGGASVDVITQSDATATNEQITLNPFIGVGTRF